MEVELKIKDIGLPLDPMDFFFGLWSRLAMYNAMPLDLSRFPAHLNFHTANINIHNDMAKEKTDKFQSEFGYASLFHYLCP